MSTITVTRTSANVPAPIALHHPPGETGLISLINLQKLKAVGAAGNPRRGPSAIHPQPLASRLRDLNSDGLAAATVGIM